MGILDRFKHKDAAQEAEDVSGPMYANTVANNVTAPRGPGERSDRRELGTDIYMLEATEAINVIKNLAYATRTEVTRTTTFVGEPPNIKPVVTEKTVTFDDGKPWAEAILIYLDTIWPTIWMSAWEVGTKKLMLRTAFYDIEETIPDQDKLKYGSIVQAAMDLCVTRLEDCIDGHKDMIVKIDTHKLEVTTNRSITKP